MPMLNSPERKEWHTSVELLSYVLLVDQFGYVTDYEIAPSPLAGGAVRVSYADFLAGKRNSLIRSTFGDDVLNEALEFVARNARLLANSSPTA